MSERACGVRLHPAARRESASRHQVLLIGVWLFRAVLAGADGISYDWQWYRVWRYLGRWTDGHFIPGPLLDGLGMTVRIALFGLALAVAAGLGAASYVHYCLYYTYKIFGDSAVGRYLKAFDRIKGEDLTGYYGLTAAQRRAWTVPLEERMTDRGFSKKFFASLSESEKEKVRTNLKYM